jgi:WD40 repeat protein
LEHSSIIYESPVNEHRTSAPLLRLACNRKNIHYLATFHLNAQTVQILDVRMPGTPVTELHAHAAPVNSIAWSPDTENHIVSCANDGQVLLWDIKDTSGHTQPGISTRSIGNSIVSVKGARTLNTEAYVASWSRTLPNWISVTSGRMLHVLHV